MRFTTLSPILRARANYVLNINDAHVSIEKTLKINIAKQIKLNTSNSRSPDPTKLIA